MGTTLSKIIEINYIMQFYKIIYYGNETRTIRKKITKRLQSNELRLLRWT